MAESAFAANDAADQARKSERDRRPEGTCEFGNACKLRGPRISSRALFSFFKHPKVPTLLLRYAARPSSAGAAAPSCEP